MKAFQCKMCGECCYGEGGISVNGEEIEKIAKFMEIASEAFISGFCQEKNGRFSIKTGHDGFCIFYEKKRGCHIYLVKPGICTLWPFYPAILKDMDNWEMAKDACPGINPECSFQNFLNQSKP